MARVRTHNISVEKREEAKKRRDAKKAKKVASAAKKWERGQKWLEENPGKHLTPLRRPKFVRELRKATIAAWKVGKRNEKEIDETGGGRGASPVGWAEKWVEKKGEKKEKEEKA